MARTSPVTGQPRHSQFCAFLLVVSTACLTAFDRLLFIDVTAVPAWAVGSFPETWGFPTTTRPFTAERSGLGASVGFGATVRRIEAAAPVRAFTVLTVVVTSRANLLTTGAVCPSDAVAWLAAAGAPTPAVVATPA